MNSNKENMAILASINLTSTSPYDSQEISFKNTINLRVYTENQGLLASTNNGDVLIEDIDIYFTAEKYTQENIIILL